MSHFIGLVFVNTNESNLEILLEPYDEQTDNEEYLEFTDCTDEIQEKFDSLPEKDERLDENGKPWQYPCDKEHYPTFESLAEDWFGYHKNADGIYGYTSNPNAMWDWYAIGNRWNGYLVGKDGCAHNELPFDDVDWEEMFAPRADGEWNKIPFCLVDTDGTWHEKGQMGWFASVSNEKDEDVWEKEVKDYIKYVQDLPGEERDAIVVYAVDFHI